MKLLTALSLLFLNLNLAVAGLDLDKYFLPEDNNDAFKAFDRLIKSPECVSGCKIDLGCKQYVFSKTLLLCKPVKLEGCGQNLTTLRFPSNQTGIIIGYGQCVASLGIGSVANGSSLEGFTVTTTSPEVLPTLSSKPASMIEMKASAMIKDVKTIGGLHGIKISAAVTRLGEEKSNANHWRLEYVSAYRAQHAGIYVDGADSNAGNATGVSVVNSCKYAKRIRDLVGKEGSIWTEDYSDCGGVYDSSFLGNTWIGSHVAGIRDIETNQPEKSYIAKGDNQRVVFIGSYAEQDSACGIISTRSFAQGGIACWGGRGLYYNVNSVSNLTLVSPTLTTPNIGIDSISGTQRIMMWRFPGAEFMRYISFDIDQRHRDDLVTPLQAFLHDKINVRIDGLNSRILQQWNVGPITTTSTSQ